MDYWAQTQGRGKTRLLTSGGKPLTGTMSVVASGGGKSKDLPRISDSTKKKRKGRFRNAFQGGGPWRPGSEVDKEGRVRTLVGV